MQSGKLASVTVVEASDVLGAISPDEGPPGDVDIGQQFVERHHRRRHEFAVLEELRSSSSATTRTAACTTTWCRPERARPTTSRPTDGGGVGFDQLGFRVPFFAVSPYARRGYVSHEVTDHTSILRFVEARFDLPAMTRRDANAAPAYDMFDFRTRTSASPRCRW